MHTIIKSFEWVTRTTSSTCCFSPARRLLLLLCLIVIGVTGTKAQSDVKFNDGVRYSQWVIDSRLGDFYGNRKKFGFNTYDRNLNTKNTVSTWYKEDGTTNYSIQVDYVAGLVAKATIEAAEYYKNFDWSKPWFKSVEWYGNKCTVPTSPDNLDAINASKMYFGIYNLANGTFKSNAESGTASNATTQLGNALKALQHYNNTYAFADGTTLNSVDIAGGWYHKSTYQKQMWLDGQYMGPATLAQLINGYSSYSSNKLTDNDWNLITKQFTIVWEQCWDSKEKLLYHAFSSEKLSNWTSEPEIWTTAQADKTKWTSMTAAGHSAAFWGRAEGWYFLALVDVLEEMQKANLTNSDNYKTLSNYLAQLAEGIKDRQDGTTGCWYQLVGKEGSYKASYYNGNSANEKSNYLESSCTAIFTAAYLKAIRLGLLEKDTYFSIAEKAYKGMVKQFMKQREDGTVDLLGCCKSAGLGTTGLGEEKFRDGSNAYYLHGYDVTPTSTNSGDYYTEGKVLGAFILAATEYERQYQSPMLLSKDLNSTYTLSSNESLSAEVLGEGNAAYQWYDATTSTAITGATNASYTPTKSGKYYCKITVTPTTAAKTRGASTEPYTITTSTADVTVAAAATTYTVTFNAGSYGKCSTTSLTQSSAGASITLPSVTANTGYTFDGWYTAQTGGTKIGGANATYTPTSNITLYAHYTATGGENGGSSVEVTLAADGKNKYKTWTSGESKVEFNTGNAAQRSYVKLSKNNTGTFTVPSGCTITKIVITYGTSTTVADMTSTATLTLPSTSNDEKFTVTQNADGTVTVTATAQVYIRKAVVTYTTGSGTTEPTPSTDASAIFTYNGSALSFTDNVATITLGSSKASSTITVNATPATGATIATSSANTSIAGNVITITTPAAGSNASYAYTVTAADGITTQTYTINVSVSSASTGETNVYSYKVKSGDTAPGINTSKYITGNSGNKLVKMTFGGWKWNNGTYSIARLGTDGKVTTSTYTDSWNNSTGGTNIASIDNYQYWFEGTQDAVDESKALTETIYGTPRYGWFVSPTRDADGKTTESHPYTLPVRGSFMTFEPTMNGTLSIYILQNGAWNTNKSGTYTDTDGTGTITYNKGDIVPGEFRPHAFHVVNQRGLTVQEFSPNYSVETRQTVTQDYWCMFPTDKDYTDTKYKDPHNVARWTEFKDYMSEKEQQRCHDNWKNGVGGAQTITELDNGSFLAVQKGIVKYTFHVTGNETYYFFSNFSKMGFAGASFLPDESQPTATPAEGQISTLELSDVTAYNKITATEKGTIEGTTLKDYTYKIGEKEIAPVAGVSIPQFYSIKLNRTFKAGQWTTLTLPFNLTEEEVQRIFGAGTQLIQLNNGTINGNAARLEFIYHEIQNVLPGHPYLIKPTGVVDETNDATASVDKNGDDITAFTVYSKCVNPFISQVDIDCGAYTFKGTPGYSTAELTSGYSVNYAENDIFISEGNGKLYVSGGSSYGKGYRAWIAKDASTSAAKISSISLVIDNSGDDDNNETTTIDMADVDPDALNALGVATGVYNLNGQKVSDDMHNLPKGIYIVNGKKIIRK